MHRFNSDGVCGWNKEKVAHTSFSEIKQHQINWFSVLLVEQMPLGNLNHRLR